MEEIKAVELAKEQKAVSIAEFFEKNRHLLGFGSKRQAMITCIKEAVDNSLDACEEARTLPDIKVEIEDLGSEKFKIVVQDNGPGVVKENLSKAFGKLLYGSKFHGSKQGRGQQGIGITSCVLYSQLTTGKPSKVTSKISDSIPAYSIKIMLDTKNNEPLLLEEKEDNSFKYRGTRVELEILGEFLASGKQSVEEYLKRTSIVNPHARLLFVRPDKSKVIFERSDTKLPVMPKRIKPHPDGLELGILIKMLLNTDKKSIKSFLKGEFSSIGDVTASEILAKAGLNDRIHPNMLSRDKAETLLKAMQETPIQAPPLDCLSPIGETALLKELKIEIPAEFYTTVTRKPTAYKGMPFQIEVGMAYGGELPKDKPAQLLRFANKVPLIYEDYACAITQAVKKTDWKRYGIDKSGSTPYGPLIMIVHMASVWVPFTSEGKQAVASYPEIIKEMKLCLMDAARKMQIYLSRKAREKIQMERANTFRKYAIEVIQAIHELTGRDRAVIEKDMNHLLEKEYASLAAEAEADNGKES